MLRTIIIVLGTMVPHVLKLRVDTAVDLWRRTDASMVILSGHRKEPALSVAETESARMLRGMRKAYASAETRFPRERVLLEHRSNNTAQNAVCSLLKARSACILGPRTKVMVVTSAFHVRRAREIFRRVWPGNSVTFHAASDPADVEWRKRLEDDILYDAIAKDVSNAWLLRTRCEAETACSVVME